MDLFVRENSMNRGSLAGAQWKWDESNLTVLLRGNGKKELQDCVKNGRSQTSADDDIE